LDTSILNLHIDPHRNTIANFHAQTTGPQSWPLDKGVNCRLGPSTDWVVIGALLVGQTATIQGKNEDATWWYVTTPDDSNHPCWVSASVTVTAGNLANLLVINPPTASVTDISVKLEPNEIILPGCIGPVQPITFKGSITVNGPAKVEWHFETEQGGSLSVHNTEFKNADTKTVEDSFTPSSPAGLWVKLIIPKPDEKGRNKIQSPCP
jgi:hypothetical protein